MCGCVVEIGNSLEMRAMSVGLQEKMIKIGSDCAQFSHPPPTQSLRLLDHYESTGRTQRKQYGVRDREAKRVLGKQKSRLRCTGGKEIHNADTQLFFPQRFI